MASALEPPDGFEQVLFEYTGGKQINPSYEDVSAGRTGHAETLEVHYDLQKITYRQLLQAFWMHIDPTDAGNQCVDRGNQYHGGIFYLNDEKKQLEKQSKQQLAESGHFEKHRTPSLYSR